MWAKLKSENRQIELFDVTLSALVWRKYSFSTSDPTKLLLYIHNHQSQLPARFYLALPKRHISRSNSLYRIERSCSICR